MYFRYSYSYIGGHGFIVGLIKSDTLESAIGKLTSHYQPALKIQLKVEPIDFQEDRVIELYEEYV